MIARYWIVSGVRTDYLPHKGDIVTIDFNPSSGSEIHKRRPALVISNSQYSSLTRLAVVCLITHAPNNRLRQTGLFVEVKNDHVDGVVNPLQFHTFDYQTRSMRYLTKIDNIALGQVLQVVRDVINAKEE